MQFSKPVFLSIFIGTLLGLTAFFIFLLSWQNHPIYTITLNGSTAPIIEQVNGADIWITPQKIYIIGSLVTVYINDPEPYQGNTGLAEVSLNPKFSVNAQDLYLQNFNGVINHVYFEEAVNNPETLSMTDLRGRNATTKLQFIGDTYTNGRDNLVMLPQSMYIPVEKDEKVYLHVWNADGRENKSVGAQATIYYIKA